MRTCGSTFNWSRLVTMSRPVTLVLATMAASSLCTLKAFPNPPTVSSVLACTGDSCTIATDSLTMSSARSCMDLGSFQTTFLTTGRGEREKPHRTGGHRRSSGEHHLLTVKIRIGLSQTRTYHGDSLHSVSFDPFPGIHDRRQRRRQRRICRAVCRVILDRAADH